MREVTIVLCGEMLLVSMMLGFSVANPSNADGNCRERHEVWIAVHVKRYLLAGIQP